MQQREVGHYRIHIMNEVNKTLFIPLYGKAQVSRQKIILNDPTAEEIWGAEQFPIHGKSASKWLSYNMAMRARIFDDWTAEMIAKNPDAFIFHIGCGLDSRCRRVRSTYKSWFDCDFPDVIEIRKKYYRESDSYHMITLNAADPEQVKALPEAPAAIIILEGISMYLTGDELRGFFKVLQDKYAKLHILMDVYTEFGAKASKYKNPINDVGVTQVYGIDDIEDIIGDLEIHHKAEHSLTPARLVDELKPADRAVFKLLFTGKAYSKIYRLHELEK